MSFSVFFGQASGQMEIAQNFTMDTDLSLLAKWAPLEKLWQIAELKENRENELTLDNAMNCFAK